MAVVVRVAVVLLLVRTLEVDMTVAVLDDLVVVVVVLRVVVLVVVAVNCFKLKRATNPR